MVHLLKTTRPKLPPRRTKSKHYFSPYVRPLECGGSPPLFPASKTDPTFDRPATCLRPRRFSSRQILLFPARRMGKCHEEQKGRKIKGSKNNPNKKNPPLHPKPKAVPIKKNSHRYLEANSAAK